MRTTVPAVREWQVVDLTGVEPPRRTFFAANARYMRDQLNARDPQRWAVRHATKLQETSP